MLVRKLQAKFLDCLDDNNFKLVIKYKSVWADTLNLQGVQIFTWISDMNVDICFINRSIEDSFPVFRSVVIASVAIDRFWSEIMLSMSSLQVVIDYGLFIATLFSARMAANRSIGFEDDKKSWRTVTAGCSSRAVTSFNSIMTLPIL